MNLHNYRLNPFYVHRAWKWTKLLALASLFVLTACTVNRVDQEPGPTITRFEADRNAVEMGQAILLSADYAHGSGVVEPEGGPIPQGGTLALSPATTTAYTLTVTDGHGNRVQKRITVMVNPGLALTVEGHEGIAGEITVAGPDGFRKNLVASGTLTGLKAGTYTITAAPAHVGGQVFHPLLPVQEIKVETGTALKVSYPAPTLSVSLPGGVPLEMVLIPAGSFMMGNDHPADPRWIPNPSPAHRVTLPEAFYLARYPTTFGQWEAVLGPGERPGPGTDLAVDDVSFDEVKDSFLPELNRKVPGLDFRLPSEAEWEYACRAGTSTTFFHGEDYFRSFEYAWSIPAFRCGNHPVGKKLPNPWGLFDLNGLVFQWCEDVAHDGYDGAPADGHPRLDQDPHSLHGEKRILRGYPPLPTSGEGQAGSSSDRFAYRRSGHYGNTGFRLAACAEGRNP